MGELAFRMVKRRLIRARIDLGEKVALLDHLAFLEADFGQLPVDLGLNRDRRERGHGSQARKRLFNVADSDLGRANRLGFRLGVRLVLSFRREKPPRAEADQRESRR